SIKADLASFAKHENAGVRGEVTAARVKAGEPAAKLLEEASKDAAILASFLAAVPEFDDSTRSSLYDGLRGLALNPPKHLQTTSGGNGLRYHYYKPHFNSAKLATVDKMKPTKSGRTKTLTYKFDGLAQDGMGFKYEGFIQAPTSGSYSFGLSSDDGSMLYINGKEIIDNDGNHGMVRKEGKVTLAGGPHRIVITYYDSSGGDGLTLDWTPPGGKKEYVPAKAFTGGDGGIQTQAAAALGSVRGKDNMIFADMVALLAAGKGGSVPLTYLRAAKARPQAQVEPLAKALADAIPATPIAQRDSDAFKANVAFAKDIANSASPATKAALLAAVSDLDLLVIRVNALVEQMKYDRPVFTVQAGKPVKIIFSNPDHLPHNLVITKPGKMEAVAKLAEKMSPDFQAHSYVPITEDILHASKLIDHGQTATLAFTAPTEPGDYDVVCTFPGHWLLMRGTMVVE
ncbi:MAG: azurin, partial [Rhodothermales bacterium]